MATPQIARSLAEVLEDIIGNFEQMIRSEFRLAKTEMREEAAKAVNPALRAGLGLLLATYGGGFLLLAAVYAMTLIMAAWLAALVVGGVLTLIGALVAAAAIARMKNFNPGSENSAQENFEWAKNRIK
jgi:uncharacterized membrane protein YqjE